MHTALLIVCAVVCVVNAGIECADREEGLYAKGCSSAFTRCHNTRSYELTCPAGLVFNPDTAKCDYSSNVALCLNRAISKNMVVKAVDPFNCTFREDGLYSNGKCTTTYFHCFRGNMAEMPCPPNLYYRSKTKSCDHENLVEECGVLLALQGRRTSQIAGSIPVAQYSAPSTFDCSRKTNGLYSSGSCSQFYYQCSNGLVYTKHCVSELFFNQQNGQCDYKESVPECNTPSNIPVAMESAATTIPPFSCVQKEDGVYSGSQGGCIHYFWMCVNMVSHLYKCPQGLYFSRETAQCDFIGEVFECNGGISKLVRQPPTPAVISFSCDGKVDGFYEIGTCVDTFVQCSGAVMLQQKCPSGLVFSAALESCEYVQRCRQAATTTVTTTQPPPVFDCTQKADGFFEIGHCDQSYVLCSNRVAYSQRCPSGLVFNILSGACDYHQNCISTDLTSAADSSRFASGGRGNGRQQGPSSQRQQPPAGRPNTRWGPMPSYTERPNWPTGMPNNWFTEAPTSSTESPSDTITPSCLDLEDGSHAFQRCSPTFYNCWAQKTYMNKCPSNLVFNAYNGQCDFARNVPECSESAGPVMPQDVPNPVRKAPQNDSFCESKLDGLFSAGCETFFYVCRSQHAYRFECPLGLYFGNAKNQCDLLENVPSCNRGLPTGALRSLPEFSCAGRQDGYYRTGCTARYYACAAGIRNQFECPSSLVYDEMKQACNYPELVSGCGNSTAKGTKSQPMPAATAAQANKSNEGFCLPLTDGVYADGCSAHYFICADAKTFTYTCPQGQVFNENTAACDSPTNVRQCRMIRGQIS